MSTIIWDKEKKLVLASITQLATAKILVKKNKNSNNNKA